MPRTSSATRLKKPPPATRPGDIAASPKKKHGPVSAYHSGLCELIVAHCARGRSFSSFAASIGRDRHTIAKWAEEHPEFAEARDRAAAACDAWFEARTLKMAEDGKGNITALIWAAKNIAKWTDRAATEVTGKDGGPIAVVVQQ